MAQSLYFARDGKTFGPVSPARIGNMAAAGQLRPTDLVWHQGMPAWTPAATVFPQLFPQPQTQNREGFMTNSLHVTSRNLDEQVRNLLRPGEAALAQIDGSSRFSNLIENLPVVRKLAEYFRRRYVVVLTPQRLVVIRVSRMLKKVKSCAQYRLNEVAEVGCEVHLLTSSVTIRLHDGTLYRLQRILKQAGPDFYEKFHALTGSAGGFDQAVRDAVAAGVARGMSRGQG